MTRTVDSADVVIRVEYQPLLLDAARAGDRQAIHEETQLLIRNTFMRAKAGLVRAAACRGKALCEPLTVAILGADGNPFDTTNKIFDVGDEDLLFVILTDSKGARLCARIEFDPARVRAQ